MLERQWGSKKFASFVVISTFLATIISSSILYLFSPYFLFNQSQSSVRGAAFLTRIAAGPYGFIFAALYQYYKQIPVTTRIRLLGVGFSDKVFLYILCCQVFAFISLLYVHGLKNYRVSFYFRHFLPRL